MSVPANSTHDEGNSQHGIGSVQVLAETLLQNRRSDAIERQHGRVDNEAGQSDQPVHGRQVLDVAQLGRRVSLDLGNLAVQLQLSIEATINDNQSNGGQQRGSADEATEPNSARQTPGMEQVLKIK